MPKVKNKTEAQQHLIVPGLEAMVEPGETVVAPDFQLDGESPLIYNDVIWELVPEPKVIPEKSAKGA
jgi:hypothetical protein